MEYLVFTGAIIALIIILKVLAWPLKKIFKMLINVAIGITALYVFNHFSGNFGFTVPVNWITALITGFLGIPGFLGILIFCIFLWLIKKRKYDKIRS